ncbi:MAG: bifunctional nuclease family protein [Deltaproteobacteria bacterium]|nr:bifunctional nuclease family protein [Deltaproteobacteria bacterium]
MVEMQVTGLTIDPANNAPIVILREKAGVRVLPIWIGVIEASAIAFELEQVKLNRPMTHDLLKTCIELLGGRVDRIAIVDLKENTYFATVYLECQGRQVELDARPSDAIALGMRARAPILCAERVLAAAQARQVSAAGAAPPETGVEDDRGDAGPRPLVLDPDQKFGLDLLERLEPNAFGKYKM